MTEPQAAPAPKPAKPRILQDGRDMFWSLAPLVLACVILAGLVGMCSFQPKGPAEGVTPSYDAPAALQADADALDFPIRLPKLPEGWQANSGGRGSIEQGRTDPETGKAERALTTRVGFIAPSQMYVSLTQSNADETALVASVHREVYQGGDGTEPVWTTRLVSPHGPAQLAITGAGTDDDFRALAAATQSQAPLVPAR